MTRINTNVGSLIGRNNLGAANASLSQALTRLSTGLRINTGADDPAGLIASENLRSDITAINAALDNTERAGQIIATADSALGEVSSLLNDIRGLITESSNSGALSQDEIDANQLQVDSSLEALNRIAQTTTFQGRSLLDGSLDFLTTAGANSTNISNLQIDQANLGATGQVAVDVNVTSAATQASLSVSGINTTPGGAVAEGSLELDIAAATATGVLQFDTPAAAATGAAAFVDIGGSFDITADTAGVAGNDLVDSIVIVDDAAAGDTLAAGVATVNFDITNAGEPTIQQVADAVSALSGVTTDNVINGSATVGAGTINVGLTGGADAITDGETIEITSAATGAAVDLEVQFAVDDLSADPDGITVAFASDVLTVTLSNEASDEVNIADIAAAINADANFNATTNSTVTLGPVASAPATIELDNGRDATTATIDITTADNAGSVEVEFVTGANIGASPVVSGNLDDGITVTVDEALTTSVAAIAEALEANDLIATATSNNPTAAFVGANDATTNSGETATLSGVATGTVGLENAVVFELAGSLGAEVLSFDAGTSIDDVIAGIELVADATGVNASVDADDAGTLNLTSTSFGSNASVAINIISEGTGETPAGTFTTAVGQGDRDTGSDVQATVNGVASTGNGNDISINTATLDLSASLTAGFTGTASFTIDGGGALFQLGPDVVSNQQARLGIGSVNTAQLGGVNGLLFQLGTGGSADLTNDPTQAGAIVEEAINQVTSLRGRLGAFQRTTLDTNANALNDTLVNLSEAESAIRDADFAEETAELTRSQILVQSGTAVLQIANQNPQNVLSLLG